MGGPGGVTGHPSTWITQLVASLSGQTGDPDRLVFLADAHAGAFVHDRHTARAEAGMPHPSACVWLSVSRCTPGPVQICGVGTVSARDSVLDRISGVVSQSHTR